MQPVRTCVLVIIYVMLPENRVLLLTAAHLAPSLSKHTTLHVLHSMTCVAAVYILCYICSIRGQAHLKIDYFCKSSFAYSDYGLNASKIILLRCLYDSPNNVSIVLLGL